MDPTSVPVAPAATVIIVDDRPDFRVLMVRRTPSAVFGGGLWVFPGGRVDPSDGPLRDPGAGSPGDAAPQLPAPAFRVAAVRETLEETGVVLATDTTDRWVHATDASELRSALVGGTDLSTLLSARGWQVPAGRLLHVAHWITPVGPPRRFDTSFFLTDLPPGAVADHDDAELIDVAWMRPGEAVADPDVGLMTPTERMLRSLARHRSAAAALAAAGTGPWQRARHLVAGDGSRQVLLPGDAGYDRGTVEPERGWVRLGP